MALGGMASERHLAPEQGAISNAAHGGCAQLRHPPHGVFSACSPYQKQAPGGRAASLQRHPPPGAEGGPGAAPLPRAGMAEGAEQPADLYELEARARRASNSHRSDAEPESVSISLASVNMQSLRDRAKCADMFRELLHSPTLNGDSEVQLFLLQELWLRGADVQQFTAEWERAAGPGSWAAVAAAPNDGGDVAAGVAILYASRAGSPSRQDVTLVTTLSDDSGRRVATRIRWLDRAYTVLCVYAPAHEARRRAFLADSRFTQQFEHDDMIAGGDWNTSIDSCTPHGYLRTEAERLPLVNYARSHLGAATDAYRLCHPDSHDFTFVRAAVDANGVTSTFISRIDTFFVSSRLVTDVAACAISSFTPADHRAVVLTLARSDVAGLPRPSWFKLPPHLVTSKIVSARVATAAAFYRRLRADGVQPGEAWGRAKVVLTFLLKGAVITTRLRRGEEKARALRKLQGLAARCARRGGHREAAIRDFIVLAKAAMADSAAARAGQRARSSVTQRRQQERPKAAFFRTLRSRTSRSPIHKLQTADGQLVDEPEDVRSVVENFFERLFQGYHAHDPDPSERLPSRADLDALLQHIPTRLSAEAQAMLSAPLSLEELEEAAKGAPNGRTPGPDGLPAELYKAHWQVLGPILLEVFSSAVAAGSEGALHPSAVEVYITLMLKKGGVRELIGSYRPLSMSCTDTKIFSRLVARRIKRVISCVCGLEQSAYIPERSIFDTIEITRAAAALAADPKSGFPDALTIFLDMEKAFDRVDHYALWATMAKLGFGSTFIDMVRLLYTGASYRVLVNGVFTKLTKFLRNVKQGDPASGFLYDILVELRRAAIIEVGRRLRVASGLPSELWGFRFGTTHILLSMFADDTTYYLNHWRFLKNVIMVEDLFCSATGSRNNWAKTRVLLPPGPRSAEAVAEISKFKLKLPPFGEPQRYLGIYLNCKDEDAWGPVLQGVAEKAALLRGFHLSLLGRVLAARVYLLSKVWFTAAAIHLPNSTLKQLNRIVFNFIHGSAPRDRSVPGRLSREVLARPPAHGGAGVPNVAESASANRFRVLSRVASGSNSSLTTIATAAHFRPEAVLAAGNLLWMSPDALKFARSPEAAQWLRLVRTHANQAPPRSLSRDEARGLSVFFSPLHVVFRDGKPMGASRVTERALAANGQTRVRDYFELDGAPVLGSIFESRFAGRDRAVRVLHQRYHRLSARASDAVAVRAHMSREVIARLSTEPRLAPGSVWRPANLAGAPAPGSLFRCLSTDAEAATVEWCDVSDTACLLPRVRANIPWAEIGSIVEMHVQAVSDLVTHVVGSVEEGHGHFHRRFVFNVADNSVSASAMTTRLFAQLLAHARLQRAPFEPLRCVEKWHKALGVPLPPGFVLTGNGFFIWLHKTDLFTARQRNFLFLHMHRRLTVGTLVRHYAIPGVDGSCAWCAGEQRGCLETAEHLFWLCAPARALWPHALCVASLLTKHRLLTVRYDAGGSPSLADYSSILFSQLPVAVPLRADLPSSCVDMRAWRLIRGLVLWTLWCLRNSLQSFPDRPAEPHFPASSAIPAFNARLKTRLVEEFFSPSRGLKPEMWAPLAAPQGASLAFCALLGGGLHPLIPALLDQNGPVQGPV